MQSKLILLDQWLLIVIVLQSPHPCRCLLFREDRLSFTMKKLQRAGYSDVVAQHSTVTLDGTSEYVQTEIDSLIRVEMVCLALLCFLCEQITWLLVDLMI